MTFEPIFVIIITRYLQKNLRKSTHDPQWTRWLNILLIAVVSLFVLEIATNWYFIIWIWHAVLLWLVYISFTVGDFSRSKQVMSAALPLILVDLFNDLLKAIAPKLADRFHNYMGLAFVAALTWMITVVVKTNKQQKALEAERQKTHEQEERSKFIASQKNQLEILVNERTAELTLQKEELEHAIAELKSAQSQLIQAEKMASLGELTAGIAHEIQNPLNFVNNFSEINSELIGEMQQELQSGNAEEALAIAASIKENEEKINHHGKRADAIVKGMLQHSRSSSGQREPTDINALTDEYFRLSYHGLRAKDKSFNATLHTSFDENAGKINIVPQEIGRVLLNLFNNAFYSVNEKKKSAPEDYSPSVSVCTRRQKLQGVDDIIISVKDNGNGISQSVIDKIYQPFFTTKPTGEGTGLGLSISYDIIKAHGGQLVVKTQQGNFAEFEITLPVLQS
jgi:two-component system, NtrC family, sensor kinase